MVYSGYSLQTSNFLNHSEGFLFLESAGTPDRGAGQPPPPRPGGAAPGGASAKSETETVYFACGNMLVRRRPAPADVESGAVHERLVRFKVVGTAAKCAFVGRSFFVGLVVKEFRTLFYFIPARFVLRTNQRFT